MKNKEISCGSLAVSQLGHIGLNNKNKKGRHETQVRRFFYIIYHTDCKKWFTRSVLNTNMKAAIHDFLQDNKHHENFTWKEAKKEGWICQKVILEYA